MRKKLKVTIVKDVIADRDMYKQRYEQEKELKFRAEEKLATDGELIGFLTNEIKSWKLMAGALVKKDNPFIEETNENGISKTHVVI